MARILSLPFILAGLALAVPAAADVKIGFVDGQRVLRALNDTQQATKAKRRLEKEFEKRSEDLHKMEKDLQALQDYLEKNSMTISDVDRRNKEREFYDMNREYQRKQREFQEDLTLRQNEEMTAIFDRATKVIKQIGESEKYDLILQEAVYFSPSIDITDKVIRALGDSGGAGAK